MIFRLAILGLGFLIFQFSTQRAMATEWVTIDKSEEHLTLGIERMVDWKRTTKKRYINNSRTRQEWSSYRDSSYREVLAFFIYELQGGYLLTRAIDIDDAMNVFNKLKNIPRPPVKESFNGLNPIKYGFSSSRESLA